MAFRNIKCKVSKKCNIGVGDGFFREGLANSCVYPIEEFNGDVVQGEVGVEMIQVRTGTNRTGARTRTLAPAFLTLVDDHLDRVFRFLMSLIRDREVAADLTQDTFLKLQQAMDAGREPNEAYVLASARNMAISWLRRRDLERTHMEVLPPEALEPTADADRSASPDRAYEAGELRQGLETAMAALPEDLRTVFHLSEIEELSYAEIAEVVGCPEGTVASRKHLAVRKLREHLKRSGHAL